MTWLSFGPRTEHPGALRADIQPVADVVADIRKLTFWNNQFDGIECLHVLEHLLPDEAGAALGELYRVLKPGGVVEVATPDMLKCAQVLLGGNLAILWNIFSPDAADANRHKWGYTPDTLRAALMQAGFVDVETLPCHPSDPNETRLRARKP